MCQTEESHCRLDLSRSFGCILYSSPLNNPLCLSTDNMVDQTKVEASEAKANELGKKVKNILIHKAHNAMSTFSLVIGRVWKLYDYESMKIHAWTLRDMGLVE